MAAAGRARRFGNPRAGIRRGMFGAGNSRCVEPFCRLQARVERQAGFGAVEQCQRNGSNASVTAGKSEWRGVRSLRSCRLEGLACKSTMVARLAVDLGRSYRESFRNGRRASDCRKNGRW